MTDVLTASEKRLLKAIAATGEAKVMVYSDGRRPWRLERGGPGWKAQTFLSLANRGYLLIEYGFAGRKDVALTNVGHEIGA